MSIHFESNIPTFTSAAADEAELERALLKALGREWRTINKKYLNDTLVQPVLTLFDSDRALGFWRPATRTIGINRWIAWKHPWNIVEETLRHEMAHQYVSEIMYGEPTSHGPKFSTICGQLCIPARASRKLDASGMSGFSDDEDEDIKIIKRIKKLMSLTDSPNEQEAKAAAAMAHSLIRKYNIEQQVLEDTQRPDFGHLLLGEPRSRLQEHHRLIAGILSRYFFVKCVLTPVFVPGQGKYARCLEISGRRSNLEMANYVHDFLLATGLRLWKQHLKALPKSARRSQLGFLAGVMSGFEVKLAQQASAEVQESGLVLAKDAALEDYYRRFYPQVQSKSWSGNKRTADFFKGLEAGKSINFRKPVREGEGPKRPRALNEGQ